MSHLEVADPAHAREARVSARDCAKFCALCLFTVCLFLGSAEFVARLLFRTIKGTGVGEDCLILHNERTGVRGIPNCVLWEKPPEGELTDYRFNSSGYRNDSDFGPKPQGTFRIVVLGTSMATGLRVPQEKTFSTLLPAELSQRSGRRVQLYNLGLPWRSPSAIARHLDEAIALKPDMILWAFTPLDLSKASWVVPTYETPSLNLQKSKWARIESAMAPKVLMRRISYAVMQTRTVMMLRDFLYSSPSLYVQSSLSNANYNSDFLRTNPSAQWQSQLREFDTSAADIEEQCRKAGIPFAAVLIPDRTQVAMVSMMGDWPKDLDPYKLDDELHSIISSHGGTYLEILPDFRTVPNPQMGYMAVDGHPNTAGHANIAHFLANKLINAITPGPNSVPKPQAALEPRH